MIKKALFWTGLAAVTAFCLYFVVRGLDYGRLWSIISGINLWLLALTILIYIGGYYIRAQRWHHLLKHIKPIKAGELFPYLVMGFMFNNVLPARAGEFIRGYMTGSRKGVSRMSAFATVVIERVFDGLVMIGFFVIGYTAFHYMQRHTDIAPINFLGMQLGIKDAVMVFAVMGSVIFAGIFVFMLLLLYKRESTVKFIHKLMAVFPVAIKEKAGKFIDTFINGLGVLGSLKDMMTVFLLTVLAWTVEVFTYWLIGRAMNLEISLLLLCLIMAVANFAIMMPSTPGGVGPFEFFGVGIMLLFAYPKEEAAAYVFVVHAMILLPIIVLGIIFMLAEGLNFTKLISEKEKEEKEK